MSALSHVTSALYSLLSWARGQDGRVRYANGLPAAFAVLLTSGWLALVSSSFGFASPCSPPRRILQGKTGVSEGGGE